MTKCWTSTLIATLAALALHGACGSSGSKDTPTCGDRETDSGEQCDDGNTTSGDGCSSTCQLEGDATCGDGVIASSETCDDANTVAGDGCSAVCGIEAGYTCTGMPSVCTGMQAGGGTCASPFQITLTDNAGTLEGMGSGDTTTSTNQVPEASCDGFDSGAGQDHIWTFTLTDTRDVVILMDMASSFDTVLRVMSTPCDLATEISEYGLEDGCSDGEGATEGLGYVGLPAGTYYIVIDGFDAAALGTYRFDIEAVPTQCGDGAADPLEFCDDGNTAAGDGCDPKCEIEEGYTCTDSEPSVCVIDPTGTPVPPVAGDLVLNEVMAADDVSDTNCDGATTGNADEFVELVNVSNKTLDLTDVTIADAVMTRHVFAATDLPPGESVVVWGGGLPDCADVIAYDIATTGQLGLTDGGDTVTVATGGATPTMLLSVTYGAATLNVSWNLNPDLTGTSYALHNAVTDAVGNFSPGTRSNETPF